ncbi:MAG: hypothetical protein U5L08_14800 [Xanthomonadales bacterium]|nr:hypothetical protein [Xanthomonadales bacterium]
MFIDPAWDGSQGRDEMAEFFDWSIVGLDGWEFPEQWAGTMVDGDRRPCRSGGTCCPGTRMTRSPTQELGDLDPPLTPATGCSNYQLDLTEHPPRSAR